MDAIITGAFTLGGVVLGSIVGFVGELIIFKCKRKNEIRKIQNNLIHSACEYARLEYKSGMYERLASQKADGTSSQIYLEEFRKIEKEASAFYNSFFMSFNQYFENETVEKYHQIVMEVSSGKINLGQAISSIRELFSKYKMVKDKR